MLHRCRSAQRITSVYFSLMRSNQALNASSWRVIHPRCSPSFFSGSGQYAESIGSSEKDTKSDTSTAMAIVNANGLNHCPAVPYIKPIGTNTATIEKVVAATAMPISSVPSCDARK